MKPDYNKVFQIARAMSFRKRDSEEFARYEAELREALGCPVWRPIEEAPKDGTIILVYSPDASEPQVFCAYWLECENPDQDGWFEDYESPKQICAWPTHFMPLPDAPEGV